MFYSTGTLIIVKANLISSGIFQTYNVNVLTEIGIRLKTKQNKPQPKAKAWKWKSKVASIAGLVSR